MFWVASLFCGVWTQVMPGLSSGKARKGKAEMISDNGKSNGNAASV